jgi:hypothetical protein
MMAVVGRRRVVTYPLVPILVVTNHFYRQLERLQIRLFAHKYALLPITTHSVDVIYILHA